MIDQDLINSKRANGGRRHMFASFHMESGTYRFVDSDANVTYDEETYIASGGLGQIEFAETEINGLSGAFTLTFGAAFAGEDGLTTDLDGLATAITKTLTGEPLQGRLVEVFVADMDAEAVTVTADPNLKRSGIIDTVEGKDGGGNGPLLRMSIEDKNYLSTLVNPREYTLSAHHEENPGSTFYEQSAALLAKDINWGKSA